MSQWVRGLFSAEETGGGQERRSIVGMLRAIALETQVDLKGIVISQWI